MYHFFGAITNKKGDALPGYCVRLTDSNGNSIALYSDGNGTPIVNVSGIADTAVVDVNGNASFWVNPGTYNFNIYAADASTLYQTIGSIPLGLDTITLAGGESVSSRSLIASIAFPVSGQSVTLTESGREGMFVFSTSNLSAQVAADPNQYTYVAPSTDTTGASGAWVRKFSGPTLNIYSSSTNTLFLRPSLNVTDGTLIYSATSDFSTAKPLELIGSTILMEPTSSVTINSTPNSYANGLILNQSTPTSGSTAGPFYFNQINCTVRSALTGGGLPGASGSGTFAGFQISVDAGGANHNCVSCMGGSAGVTQTVADTSTGDKNGFSSGVSISASTLSKLYGGSAAWTVSSGGSCTAAVGFETDVTISGTGSVPYAVGFNAWKGGTGSGTNVDTAYAIGISGAAGTAKWKTGLLLYTQGGATASPVDSGFTLFKSDSAATIGTLLDCSNITISANVLVTPNIILNSAGALSLNTPLALVSIGSAADTSAWLTAAACTATKASLKLLPGAAPTTPLSGQIYSTGTHLYWVDSVGTSHQLDN